ncbi:MAG TPA: hypothetical protein VGH28_19590 [Polyangiaceae bacterium]
MSVHGRYVVATNTTALAPLTHAVEWAVRARRDEAAAANVLVDARVPYDHAARILDAIAMAGTDLHVVVRTPDGALASVRVAAGMGSGCVLPPDSSTWDAACWAPATTDAGPLVAALSVRAPVIAPSASAPFGAVAQALAAANARGGAGLVFQ